MNQIAIVILSSGPFAWEFCLTEAVLENARDNLQAQLLQPTSSQHQQLWPHPA
jgi:hypothetical protein